MKWLAARFYTWCKKSNAKPQFSYDPSSTEPSKMGMITLPEARYRENPRQLSDDPNAVDTIGFSGVKGDGSALLVRVYRRHGRRAEVMIYLRLASGTEYVHPHHQRSCIYNTDNHSFTAGGLYFEVLEPLRIWRVTYNGYLRKLQGDGEDEQNAEIVPVRFVFVWHPIYCYVEFPEDINHGTLATLLTKMRSFGQFVPPWALFKEQWHEQIGELHGLVYIENSVELEMFFRGLKIRRHGILDFQKVLNKISIQGYVENGMAFHLFVDNIKEEVENFIYGYVCPPCAMVVQHITKCKFSISTLYKMMESETGATLTFVAGDTTCTLEIAWTGSGFSTILGQASSKAVIRNINVILNGKHGHGIVEHLFPCRDRPKYLLPQKESLPLLQEVGLSNCPHLTVSFDDEECSSSKLVGGKGASLGLITNIVGEHHGMEIRVPQGICITKTAFNAHLEQHPDVISALQQLQDVAWQRTTGVLSDECQKVVDHVLSTQLASNLKSEIQSKLTDIFGPEFETERFAVRSSAIGEDGEELSAAGQNETFLGVSSLQEICKSVVKCWASQFAFRSVEYKRQNGQLLNGGMGVVIQKMVPADVAGVLFSRDPLSGSPATMTITSNYGLGESVVSATADPDTIILARTWDDNLSVADTKIGSKATMVSMSEKSGTIESEVESDKVGQCTLSDEDAIRLGHIAVFLEQCFGNARDIEWAIKNGVIYLLQCRPVTTDTAMTDFEIIHEFDTAMRTDGEYYTIGNIGEVMPGAQAPLTEIVIRAQLPFLQEKTSWRLDSHRYDPTIIDMMGKFYGHIMSERLQLKSFSLSEKKAGVMKAIEVAFYGRVLDDADEVQMAIDRYTIRPPKMKMLLALQMAMTGVFAGETILNKTLKKYGRFPDPTLGCSSISEAYKSIEYHVLDIKKTMIPHGYTTSVSTMWNAITLNILSQGSDYTLEHYSDFAMLVGSCNGAESGDVPFSLKNLALTISKEMDPKTFSSMTSEDALQWLQKNDQDAGQKFDEFLDRHGHRGLKEFCLSCTSWAMDPKQLIVVLQDMLKHPEMLEKHQEKSAEDVIRDLKSPLSNFKKGLLLWVMKRCRDAVCNRERAKSLLIKTYEGLRLGYRSLANMMVKEGFIPEPNLIFFFSHEEIAQLLETRSAKVIRRVKHRFRLHPHMDKLQFEEMIHGYPIPIDDNTMSEELMDGTEVKGYPVSHGVVEALARVVMSFHDVHSIQPGEILITHATDIGWSPYFPMLAGVVTEIGGLISHGAVVAREFGLPCIIGAQNATRVFKSGDRVVLNATKGTITKLQNQV